MSSFLSDFPDEDDQAREVYAVYGLAAYMAAVLESGLAIDLTMLELISDIRNIKTEAEWQARHDTEMEKAHRLPLGAAIIRFRKKVALSEEASAVLSEALIARNYLIHHFFRDKIEQFYSPIGRARLHETLMSYVELFQRAERMLHAATATVRQKIGLTDDKLARTLEQYESELRSKG